MTVRLTKNELRTQQNQLIQLQHYLPTLQLKKALLQSQVNEAKLEIEKLFSELHQKEELVAEYAPLLSQKLSIDLTQYVRIYQIKKRYENIAGSEVPIFEEVLFNNITYDLFDTPVWLESAIFGLRGLSWTRGQISVAEERKKILEQELRAISIRVNLFEKILIPRAENNIKKIKVFLGDQFLALIGQAKVAKQKIEQAALVEGNRDAP